ADHLTGTVAYVDNCLFGWSSPHHHLTHDSLAKKIDAIFQIGENVPPSDEVSFLGLTLNARTKEIDVEASYLERAGNAALKSTKEALSIIEVWKIFGTMMRIAHIRRMNLSSHFTFFRFIRRISHLISAGQCGWNRKVKVCGSLSSFSLAGLTCGTNKVGQPDHLKEATTPIGTVVVFTDASDTRGGHVIIAGGSVQEVDGYTWSKRMRNRHINEKEAAAAIRGWKRAKQSYPDQVISLAFDNLTVVGGIRKGLSKNYFINLAAEVIRSEDGLISYVNTKENPADLPSRKATLDRRDMDDIHSKVVGAIAALDLHPITKRR
ncbi:MAG: hypothetical protein KAG66_18680, partial [Methylococcales bacterium]|nr:hypothetical protein [Methylococcales bacterium]